MNTKKIISLSFLILVFFIIETTAASAKDFLFVGQDYPPFNYLDGKAIKGGTVDVIKIVCGRLKHRCGFQVGVPLARALDMFKKNQVDGFLSLVPSEERKAFAIFSAPIAYSNQSYMILENKNIPEQNQIEKLDGWTVGGVRESFSIKTAKEHQDTLKSQGKALNIVEEIDNKTVVKKLLSGRYGTKGTVIAGTEEGLKFYVRQENPNAKLQRLYKVETLSFVLAFSKKKYESESRIVNEFNVEIEKLRKSGELAKILDHYNLKTSTRKGIDDKQINPDPHLKTRAFLFY
jgi:polar amino acid transport system substrate-binding protein